MATAQELETVGMVTAVQGTVTMQPATLTAPVKLRAYDQVGPLAILHTDPGSRCKILYTDDSLVTLGENTRFEVTEQSYRAGSDRRVFVAHLTQGSVRSLIARPFEEESSIFEVHAGTALATARGTYFVVWMNDKPPEKESRRASSGKTLVEAPSLDTEGASGVANLGRSGNVSLTSGGATVLVLPGQYSIALPGAPPTTPAAIRTPIGPVAAAISSTQLTDIAAPESPRAALAAAGIGAAEEVTSTEPPKVATRVGQLGGQAPSGSYMLPDWPYPVTPVTPPAVVSGAAPASVNTTINLNIRLP
jgi:hypothetical protein